MLQSFNYLLRSILIFIFIQTALVLQCIHQSRENVRCICTKKSYLEVALDDLIKLDDFINVEKGFDAGLFGDICEILVELFTVVASLFPKPFPVSSLPFMPVPAPAPVSVSVSVFVLTLPLTLA